MEGIQDFDKIQKRFDALWNCEIVDRCCISVFASKPGYSFWEYGMCQPGQDAARFWTDGEVIRDRYDTMFSNTYFAGEALPVVVFNLGTGGQAGYVKGAKYHISDTVWFDPTLRTLDANEIVFDANSTLYKTQMGLLRYLSDEFKGKYLLGMPDNVGNIDALAHLRGSENLMMDMLENPGQVHTALDTMQTLWQQVTEEALALLHKNNGGSTSIGWLATYSKGKHLQLQADISVMLSPAMFNEFALPELVAQSEYLDTCVYHLDGQQQIRHLDSILSVPGINMIQWTDVAGQARATEFLPVLQRIQQAGKGLLLQASPLEIPVYLEHLSSRGLYLVTYAQDKEQADALVALAAKMTHE